MILMKNNGAVNALLDEYRKVVVALQKVISGISDENLMRIIDTATDNPDCKSIQTVLAHVVNSGFAYCIYIRKSRNMDLSRPQKALRSTIPEYSYDLDKMMDFTVATFENIQDSELEEYDNSKKMTTSWGQKYDIEQITEHAIVHILRHRRQIERFKSMLEL